MKFYKLSNITFIFLLFYVSNCFSENKNTILYCTNSLPDWDFQVLINDKKFIYKNIKENGIKYSIEYIDYKVTDLEYQMKFKEIPVVNCCGKYSIINITINRYIGSYNLDFKSYNPESTNKVLDEMVMNTKGQCVKQDKQKF